jgi:acyl dehydratase
MPLTSTIVGAELEPRIVEVAGVFVRTRAVTGVGGTGAGVQLGSAPAWPAAADSPEQRSTIETQRESAHVYTQCSAIWNPIHAEWRAARAAGLPGIILHGTAIWAMAGRELIRLYGQDEPARLRRLRARFSAMVMPGEALTLRSRPSPDRQCVHFVLTNAEGRSVADGFAGFAGDRSAAGAE